MRYILIYSLILSAFSAAAQDSSGRRREVNVTSSFKPVLKDAAKINFNAAPPTGDTSRPRLHYNVPNQNLALGYQPGSLKPVALLPDTLQAWDNYNYVKAGYGTLRSPYFETGLSLGDGINSGANIYGRHISAKGKIPHQDFGNTDIAINGFVKSGNLRWTGKVGASDDRYKRYGYEPKNLIIPRDSINLRYQNFVIRAGVENIERTEFGLSYAPQLELNSFTDDLNNRETSAYLNAPLRKTFEGKFEVAVRAEGNFIRFNRRNNNAISNNWLSIAPSLLLKTAVADIDAGIKPAWNNGQFELLPNVMVNIGSSNKQLSLQAGWVGHIRANGFRQLTEINPWIYVPPFSFNSVVKEIYAGIRGALTPHFSYAVRAGYNRISNQPLFVNDTATGKGFIVINEPRVNNLNITGTMGYTVGEKFSLQSSLFLNNYSGLLRADKPWGLLPFEFKTALRLQIIKDLYLRSDLWAFDAPWYQTKAGRGRSKGGADLSAGLEFAIVKNVKLWGQFNNILNNEYQRWQQYPVYGFNFLGGVVFSFNQNKK